MTCSAKKALGLRTAPLVFAAALLLPAFSARARAQNPEGAGASAAQQSGPPSAASKSPAELSLPPTELFSSPEIAGRSPAPSAPKSTKATLAQFAWLAGRWQGAWGPRVAQEVWMPTRSGTMVGVFQLTENSKTLVIELYSIQATARGIELRVRHFTPALDVWEKSPALLKLKSADSKSILFENEGNGQPKHWMMKRTDADTYVARFEIVPEKGESQIAEIIFHRQPVAPASH